MSRRLLPMAPVDAGWFHMDGRTNLAMVTGVTLTRERLDVTRVKEVFQTRILSFDRFRQRVVEHGLPLATPHWAEDPDFELDDHIHHIALPAPGDETALMELLSDLASTPLDYKRPLWQVHVVDGVHIGDTGEEGGSAFVMRFHHCIGDGTAMMAVAQRLFDARPDAPPQEFPKRQKPPQAGMLDRIVRPAQQAMSQATHLAGSAVQGASDLLAHPTYILDWAQFAARSAGVAVGTLFKTPDPQTPLKGKLGLHKRVAWSAPVALEDVKAIGGAHDAKVNDVLVAAMAGALRHYFATRQATVEGVTVRAVVPVDLRPAGQGIKLGNRFGLVFLEMPIGLADAWERLRRTKAGMDAIKRSPEAPVFMGIIGIFGRTPKPVEDLALEIFGSKATLVLTNVAGPRQPLYLAGATVERIMFWVPHPADLGMGVSIFSYNGQVTVAVVTDAGLVPDPEVITAAFEREFAAMRAAVEQAPPNEHDATAVEVRQRCAATTRAGSPCKKWAVAGSPYCQVHRP